MVRRIHTLLLLAALLMAFMASAGPAFASNVCHCLSAKCFGGKVCPEGGCQFDKKTSQCVNISCDGLCF